VNPNHISLVYVFVYSILSFNSDAKSDYYIFALTPVLSTRQLSVVNLDEYLSLYHYLVSIFNFFINPIIVPPQINVNTFFSNFISFMAVPAVYF
jgi:hypothetical protein